jgi:arylsulfatase A-like enzyme
MQTRQPSFWEISMNKQALLLLLLSTCAVQAAPEPGEAVAGRDRPNIVLIMADDMGISDIGCYGGEVQTPNLNKLARNGIRFTQFYNTSRCCPTRACLLTGLYPHQAGIGWMMQDKKLPGYQGDLNRNCRTIAEVLKPAGYSTYMSGKWHVTKKIAPDADKSNWPRQRGFDRFFGTIHGAGSYYDPNTLTRDNTYIAPGKDFYYTDAITANAVRFISEHRNPNPFFLYVAYTSPHWPMHARPEDIRKYEGRYNKGWDVLRQERYARMIKMGLVDPRWKLTPRDPQAPAWEKAPHKEWYARRMEVYAAMIDRMDQGIGRIVQALESTGRFDNTLILFLADNGGCAEEMGSKGPIRPDPKKEITLQPMAAGELQTRMVPKVTRDGRPVRQGVGVMPGPADTYLAYGLPWANASNTPYRRYKHWVHEGGISTPLIAHWPRGITRERHNQLEGQPGHLIDVMATCVDVSGASYPKKVGEHAFTPLQGVSLRPTFTGGKLHREQPLFWEHEGNRAIRTGKWKLVARGPRGPWELYDLEVDRTELNDLAAKQPDRVKDMAQRWEAWAIAAQVKPWPWDKKK